MNIIIILLLIIIVSLGLIMIGIYFILSLVAKMVYISHDNEPFKK